MKQSFLALFMILWLFPDSRGQAITPRMEQYFLIAHRGGVVDSARAENSLPALQAAIDRGYNMVEVDLRLTKDGHLIVNHDADFRKYYHVNRLVSEMDWEEISKLRSDRGGSRVLLFEEVLRHCKGKMQIMIDNKIPGNDTLLFQQVVDLLKRYGMQEQALMIGTTASTPFFTGKIKLSCTRAQLENNMLKPGYDSSHYYLFGADLTKEDVDWAKQNHILAVGVVNEWRYRRAKTAEEQIRTDIQRLKDTGLTHFQIDSAFEHFFMED